MLMQLTFVMVFLQSRFNYFCVLFNKNSHHSRVRSTGSGFTPGAWGLRMCSLDAPQLFATVRDRSQPFARGRYGRAYGKFCNRRLEVSHVA